jgi:hypothetical protein
LISAIGVTATLSGNRRYLVAIRINIQLFTPKVKQDPKTTALSAACFYCGIGYGIQERIRGRNTDTAPVLKIFPLRLSWD